MKKVLQILTVVIFGGFLLYSHIFNVESGLKIGEYFWQFFVTMVKIIPAAIVLISLFEVWVNRKVVERHLGEGSHIKGFLWAIILAGTIVGGLYVAFPLSVALYRKGARTDVIFTFLFAATICRVPMTLFEANFLGIKFTLIRFLVSLPLVILTSVLLAKISEKYDLMRSMSE